MRSLASWPNLTPLLFLYSTTPDVPSGGSQVTQQYPLQGVMLYHYGTLLALGYALSMFSGALRDRKPVRLRGPDHPLDRRLPADGVRGV